MAFRAGHQRRRGDRPESQPAVQIYGSARTADECVFQAKGVLEIDGAGRQPEGFWPGAQGGEGRAARLSEGARGFENRGKSAGAICRGTGRHDGESEDRGKTANGVCLPGPHGRGADDVPAAEERRQSGLRGDDADAEFRRRTG